MENEFSLISERIFTSLDATYDVDELVKSINGNIINAVLTGDMVIDLTNNSENIQTMIIIANLIIIVILIFYL